MRLLVEVVDSSSTTTTAAASEHHGHDHGLGRIVADEGVHKIGKDFEAAHPGTKVKFNFDASSTLVTQIQSGAPADVFASADQSNMDKVTSANLTGGTPIVFAKNKLEIATKPGNPKNITGLSSLATAGIIALCAEDAPCGKYADQVLEQAERHDPREQDHARPERDGDARRRSSQGDADAGIVYVTDVKGAGSKVDGVDDPRRPERDRDLPDRGAEGARKQRRPAQAFVDYVTSPAGQQTLQSYGFLAP